MPSRKPAPAPELLVYMRADGNYTWSHYQGAPKQIIAYNLKTMIERSAVPMLRTHNSTAVNLAYVVRLVRVWPTGSHVVLTGGEQLPVSRRRFELVERALQLRNRVELTD